MSYTDKLDLARNFIEEADDNTLLAIINCINDTNGDLNSLVWYNMSDFNELLCDGIKPWDIARAITFGDFNAMHDYWRWNVYGNLESVNYLNYDDEDKNDVYDALCGIDIKYWPDEILNYINSKTQEEEHE